MSFDLDDPLADILSGGSDDSFFDDDILGKKKTPKKSTPLASKKSALFNLNDDIKPSGSTSIDTKHTSRKGISDINLESIPKPTPVTTSSGTSKEQIKTPIKSNDPLDFVLSAPNNKSLERLGSLDRIATPKMDPPAKTFEKRKSSISILDDLLGPSTKTSTQAKTSSNTKGDFDFEGLLGKSDTLKRPTTAVSKPSVQADSAKIVKAAKTLTPSAKATKKSNDDWLGIFNKEDSNPENSNAADDPGIPAWLVGKDSQTSKSSAPIAKPADPPSRAEPSKTDVPEENPKVHDNAMKENPSVFNQSLESILQASDVATRSVPGLVNMLNTSTDDITQEGATLYMQQQESQLMVALQLKAQEEKLAALQRRQEESKKIQQQASMAQQTQVAAMLETQAAHRQQMQAIITGHQQRINERIKALLTPIQSESNGDDEVMASGGGEAVADGSGAALREAPHAKEKKQLLQLVQTLQENHDKEIDLMETSYRRQLAITDAALVQSEERMRAETEHLVKHYVERLEWAESEARAQRARARDDAKLAEQRHEQLLGEERTRSAESAKALREQHSALMDNIKNAVAQERALVEDWSTVSAELAALAGEVRGSRSAGKRLLEAAREWREGDAREAERALQAREAQVQEMLEQLSKERERLDKEKSEDRETMKLLEARLRQMTQCVEEETGAMKQRRMEFEFEKATFNKQTEFAKNILKKQDEEMKTMKEQLEREYKEKLSAAEEERDRAGAEAGVAARERLTVHNLKQELEKLKAELQAQMEDVSEERSRLNIEKQHLHMEEQRIIAKSRDLDLLAKSAIEKQSLADRKHSEAEYAQRKYEDRVRRLQEHVISLNTREKDIAREKVALSRERLDLHNDKRQLESRQQCSLCRSIQNQVPFLNVPAPIHHDAFPNLNSEYLSMGVSRDRAGVARQPASVLEQEMSNLLIRGTSTIEENAVENNNGEQNIQPASVYKEMVDPKLLLLRLDVQQVISNLSERREPP